MYYDELRIADQRGSYAAVAPQSQVQAPAGGWFDCEVTSAGAGWGTIYIHLRELNGEFDGWYQPSAVLLRDMLTTALTAISSERRVQVHLATTDEYGEIQALYLRNVKI
jgi:hypothetical protein